MAVALRLRTIGVNVSSRAAGWALPPWYSWPGSMYLVGSSCDADLTASRKASSVIGGRSVKQQPPEGAVPHQILREPTA
jgi:hypothetical protein